MSKVNQSQDLQFCPLIKAECVKQKCKFWVHITGKDPQNGAEMNFPDCAVRWLPLLLLENAKETRQAAAAVESFRNESKKDAAGIAGALLKRVEEQVRGLSGSLPLPPNA